MFAYNLRGVYHCLIPDSCVRICEIPNRQEQSANNAFFVSQAASRYGRAKPWTLPLDVAQSVGCLWQTAQSYAKKSILTNATAKKMWRLGESFVILQAVIKAGKPGRSLRGKPGRLLTVNPVISLKENNVDNTRAAVGPLPGLL